jgi:hypothetical protein
MIKPREFGAPIVANGAVKEKIIRKKNDLKWAVIVLSILVIIGCGSSCYFYFKYTNLKNNPRVEAKSETEILLAKVDKLMELPRDETPTVATVADAEQLKNQKFFQNAQNGDKVLAYAKSMKAILYRPSLDKIIEVAPMVFNGDSNAETSATGTPAVE